MISTREAYSLALLELGKENPNVVVVDADLSVSTGTHKFAKAFPDRFFDVGCAEQNAVGVAAGLATAGKTVFVSTYSMFLMRAWEQIRNTVAFENLNVKFICAHSGLTNAADGSSHQCLEDIAIMRVIPNMRVLAPCDEYETALMIAEEAELPGPCYMRLSREVTPPTSIPGWVNIRYGDDIVIFATGTMVYLALDAQNKLHQKHRIESTVVNLSTLKPVKEGEILIHIDRCKKAITIEEHSIYGGLGGIIAEISANAGIGKVKRMGVNDCFGESGTYDELLNKHGLTVDNIVKTAKEMCK
jgi:transketolase